MLVEREEAIEQFAKAADRLSDGYGGIVLVSGESGIGKTSLLEEARRNSKHNFTFFWSGSDPLFTPRPFGSVHDMANKLGQALQAKMLKQESRHVFSYLIGSLLDRNIDQLSINRYNSEIW